MPCFMLTLSHTLTARAQHGLHLAGGHRSGRTVPNLRNRRARGILGMHAPVTGAAKYAPSASQKQSVGRQLGPRRGPRLVGDLYGRSKRLGDSVLTSSASIDEMETGPPAGCPGTLQYHR